MLPHPARRRIINIDLDDGKWYRTKMSPRNHLVLFGESQYHVINAANPRGALDDRIEHRLHVRRRAADDAEHLGRGRLMLQGLSQFCVSLLDLLEQSDILDSDDSLVGKGFEQSNLLVRERPDLPSQDQDSANGNAFTKQRCRKRRAMSPALLEGLRFGKFDFNFSEEVMHVNCLTVGYGSARYIATGDWSYVILSEGFQLPK